MSIQAGRGLAGQPAILPHLPSFSATALPTRSNSLLRERPTASCGLLKRDRPIANFDNENRKAPMERILSTFILTKNRGKVARLQQDFPNVVPFFHPFSFELRRNSSFSIPW
jgi:hypothetical protein